MEMTQMRRGAYHQDNVTYWTGRASGYSAVNQDELATGQRAVWGSLLRERIGAQFPGRDPGDIRVLDIGTGPGFFAILMAEAGYDVTAVDYTAAMLREARQNAGPLADRICFRQMNAEALDFPSARFDVVLSRNLTWNLADPEAAYRQWVRVLKPGGLLLNFDANWYRYLYDEAALGAHAQDRQNVADLQVEDDTAGTDVDAMEAIARQAPLSRQARPVWDAELLRRLGMRVEVEREIWRRVWTRAERITNASTPMFLIRAVKRRTAALRRAERPVPAVAAV